MRWRKWIDRWNAAIEACKRLDGETEDIVLVEPASREDLIRVEGVIGHGIPESFSSVLTSFASRVEVTWSLPEDAEPPVPLEEIFSGICSWDLARLGEINLKHQDIVRRSFHDTDDPSQKLWHNKLIFQKVENGDRLALDLSVEGQSPVIYLSPFRGRGNGYKLGENFEDFIERWTLVGCPGPEIWQMLPFIPSPTSGIDPDSRNAKLWRTWFGLHFASHG